MNIEFLLDNKITYVFLLIMVSAIFIIIGDYKNSKKEKRKEYKEKIENKIRIIDRRMEIIKTTKNYVTIESSKRIILQTIAVLKNEKQLEEKKLNFYNGEFQIVLYELINERLIQLADEFENDFLNGIIKNKTYQKKLYEIEKILEPTVLNYDHINNIISARIKRP